MNEWIKRKEESVSIGPKKDIPCHVTEEEDEKGVDQEPRKWLKNTTMRRKGSKWKTEQKNNKQQQRRQEDKEDRERLETFAFFSLSLPQARCVASASASTSPFSGTPLVSRVRVLCRDRRTRGKEGEERHTPHTKPHIARLCSSDTTTHTRTTLFVDLLPRPLLASVNPTLRQKARTEPTRSLFLSSVSLFCLSLFLGLSAC